jgi:hypothetical protein
MTRRRAGAPWAAHERSKQANAEGSTEGSVREAKAVRAGKRVVLIYCFAMAAGLLIMVGLIH